MARIRARRQAAAAAGGDVGTNTTGTTTAATAAAVGGPLSRIPDASDPLMLERMRRLFEKRRMQNGGRLSTILSDELRNRVA